MDLGCLSVSETGDAIGFRKQLSTTSVEAFELEITVNYPVHTRTESDSFMQNLTSWSVPFWIVLLTEHKVLHCYATKAVFRWLPDNCTRLSDSLQQTVDASKFHPCQAIHSTAFVHHAYRFDRWRFLIRIACSCEIFTILFNFHWYLGLDSFPR